MVQKVYGALYQELQENWERLYWDEGYSMKIANDHAISESAEDDDLDFFTIEVRVMHTLFLIIQGQATSEGGDKANIHIQNQDWGSRPDDSRNKVAQARDKFEHDREKRTREKAFAPMNGGDAFSPHHTTPQNQPFDPS